MKRLQIRKTDFGPMACYVVRDDDAYVATVIIGQNTGIGGDCPEELWQLVLDEIMQFEAFGNEQQQGSMTWTRFYSDNVGGQENECSC
jgi:hypothetical protein